MTENKKSLIGEWAMCKCCMAKGLIVDAYSEHGEDYFVVSWEASPWRSKLPGDSLRAPAFREEAQFGLGRIG